LDLDKSLCERHSDFKNRLKEYDRNRIVDFYEQGGLKVSFVKGEGFFKVLETIGEFRVQFNTIPENGFLQFVLDIKKGNTKYNLSWGVWEAITRELLKVEAGKPSFTSYEERQEILKEALSIYEDFKQELLKMQGSQA
jgi:hypothetical protein